MPFQIETDPALLRVTMSGALTSKEILAYAAEVVRLESGSPVSRNLLTDFSPITAWNFDAGEMQVFAAMRSGTPLKNRVKSAIVAPRNVDFGMGRMFELMVRNPEIEVRVFRDAGDAMQWLEGSGRE